METVFKFVKPNYSESIQKKRKNSPVCVLFRHTARWFEEGLRGLECP